MVRILFALLLSTALFGQATPWIPSNTKTIDLPKTTEPATKADKGRIWVDASGALHFKNTDGVDVAVGSGGSGDITTLAWTPPGTGGVATTQQAVNERYISVLDYLNATDRAKALAGTTDYDATYAFTAAMNRAVATGISKVYAPGRYAANIVINQSGVVIKGSGMQALSGTPGSYIAPWNTASPVIQIGNDTGYVTGSGVEDLLIYTPSGTGQKGLVFDGGAYKSYCRNVQSRGFTVSCIEATNNDVYPCTFIRMDNISAVTNVQGARGIAIIDKHTVGTGWTTAIEINGFDSTASYGYQLYVDSASASLSNGYLQSGISGFGLYIKKGYSYAPSIHLNGIEIDSMSYPPSGWPYVSVIYDGGVDFRVAGQWTNHIPINGQLRGSGAMMVLAGHTTGSITSGQDTLTVASAANIRPGRQVHVVGAGQSGGPLIATVNSISGNVLTLAANASATVSSVDIGYGDLTSMDPLGFQVSALSTPGVNFQASNKRSVYDVVAPSIYRESGTGVIEPASTFGLVVRTGYNSPEFHISPVDGAQIPSSITQSGTTITVTTPATHYGGVGDLVLLDGCNEAGVNGLYSIASYVTSTSFTVTSGTSQTLAGVTGSPKAHIFKVSAWRNGRLELPAGSTGGGVALRNNSGATSPVLYHDLSTAGTRLQTGVSTTGFFGAQWGSSVTTGAGFVFGNSSANKIQMTGNGVFKFALTAAPSLDASFGQLYTSSANSQVYTMNPAGTATLLSLDKTITAAGTTGARTINNPLGSVNFAAGATSLVVTNSLVTTSSVIICTVGTNDTTMKSVSAVAASGSFTIYANAAATAETRVNFRVHP